MTHAIVPPYLLARIAAAQQLEMARAARAAQATLASSRELTAPQRTRARLSIEEPGTLVVESAPAVNRTISDATGSETLPGERVRGEDDAPAGDGAIDEGLSR